jgi:hypothetical protein
VSRVVAGTERDAEECEKRAERSPADQATGGIVHPNGTHIVSQDTGFLAACVRLILTEYGFELAKPKRGAA